MQNSEEIKNYKTAAWTDPGIANWYASRMMDHSFRVSLKHQLEGHWLHKEVIGPKVLDVGIGTGRGVREFVCPGWQLTGVDSSQAMLDICRDQFGPAIDLRLGEATNIPFESNMFDSAIGLNLVTHFPDWKPILNEMLRVVRGEGRIIFDVYSKDHAIEAISRFGVEYVRSACGYLSSDPSKFNLYLSVHDLKEYCVDKGCRLERIIPYGASLAGDLNLLIAESTTERYLFDRLISISDSEDWFRSWILSLERDYISNLSPKYAGKFIAVIKKCQSDEHWSYQPISVSDISKLQNMKNKLLKALECPNVSRYIKYLIRGYASAGCVGTIREFFEACDCDELNEVLALSVREANLIKTIEALRAQSLSKGSYGGVPWATSYEYEFVKYIVESGGQR